MGMPMPGAKQNQNKGADKGGQAKDPKDAKNADPGAGQDEKPGDADQDADAADADEQADDLDDSSIGKLDDKTQGYIKKLRSESAKYRTKAKELETKHSSLESRFGKLEGGLKKALGLEGDDKTSPEDKITALEQQTAALQFRTAVQEMAIEHGLNAKQSRYFQHLLSERASEMEEGQELADDALAELVAEAKSIGAAQGQNGGNGRTSPTGNGKGGKAPAPGGSDSVLTAEQFAKLNTGDKSALYQKDPTTYSKLLAEAKAKNLF